MTSSLSLDFYRGQAEFLRNAGFETAFVSAPGPKAREFAERERVRVHEISMEREISLIRDFRSMCRLWLLFRRIRPVVTNVGTPKAGLLGGLAAVFARVPNRIYTLHGLRLETSCGWKRLLLLAMEKIACRTAHRIRCVSPSLRSRVSELGIAPPEKLFVIGKGTTNGIDISSHIPTPERRKHGRKIRAELNIHPDAVVIGFVGRFTRDKGIADLYEAFQIIRGQDQTVMLLLVGDYDDGDPVPSYLRSAIDSDPAVVRTGVVPSAAPFFHAMDLFVLPTYREGFPIVTLEAQASGLPVITTTATGAIDSVLDGRTGVVVPVSAVCQLARVIEKFLKDTELRSKMGNEGRDWVAEHFSRQSVWSSLREDYLVMVKDKCEQQPTENAGVPQNGRG